MKAGVPQGSALSPLLYSAYTNDISRPSSSVQLALFTDDTALFFRSRDLELPIVLEYMKDASKRFFDIAGSHPNAFLRAAVDYEPPHSSHFIRRPRNVHSDPPDALTAAVESLNDVHDTHD
ncbi:Probable RNA-directed DNA polymerase from transposon X-element [Eumeta japonica]|uniref:Probable RNA-directed DNA polymerase from transposon X-element n=1 Tax=Eumeta variegata TaxID=151549 RepID=A0A4C1YRU3_EUMVA|nr:Probable RNA-directed DNA polymerase from transposon X-element [Eumeta japonica]